MITLIANETPLSLLALVVEPVQLVDEPGEKARGLRGGVNVQTVDFDRLDDPVAIGPNRGGNRLLGRGERRKQRGENRRREAEGKHASSRKG